MEKDIESLRFEIREHKSEISVLNATINDLNNEIEYFKIMLSTEKNTNERLNAYIALLKKDIARLEQEVMKPTIRTERMG